MKKLVLLLIVAIALPLYAEDVILDYQDVLVDGQTMQVRGTTTFTSSGLSSLFSGWWAFEFPLIKFDLSDAPAVGEVDTVILSLYCKTGTIPAGLTPSVVVGIQGGNTWDPYANQWDSTATHYTYYGGTTGPAWSGVHGATTAPWIQSGPVWASRYPDTHQYGYVPVSSGQYANIDITPLVLAWLNDPSTNNGLYIGPNGATVGGAPGGDNYSNVYGSSEYGASQADASVGPRLLFVPEPATMLLLLGGALTLIRRKR